MDNVNKIYELHDQGKSNAYIAIQIRKNPKTVGKYVNEYEAQRKKLCEKGPDGDSEKADAAFIEKPRYDSSNRKPSKGTPEVRDIIKECLEDNERKLSNGRRKQQMMITDIHRYLKSKGYAICYTTVRNIVAELRESKPKEAFTRQEYEPGKICEFDCGELTLNIGGKDRKLVMAVFTSAYSMKRYALLFNKFDSMAFKEAHSRFFEETGAVYHVMVYDNARVQVSKVAGDGEKEPSQALRELSFYYGYGYRFCNECRGNEKPHVERSVDVVRRRAFSGMEDDAFPSLEKANKHLLEVCKEMNNEKITDGTVPAERFEEERPYLLPGVPKLRCCEERKCNVCKYSTITVGTNHYSVPEDLVKKKVNVDVFTDRIEVYYGGELVAKHARRLGKSEWTIDINHFLKTFKKKPGALPGSTALKQADTQIKKIYEVYYSTDAKTFLAVLQIIRERGAGLVLKALKRLYIISPKDLSADKVEEMCVNIITGRKGEAGKDYISKKSKDSLKEYDALMEAQSRVSGKEDGT